MASSRMCSSMQNSLQFLDDLHLVHPRDGVALESHDIVPSSQQQHATQNHRFLSQKNAKCQRTLQLLSDVKNAKMLEVSSQVASTICRGARGQAPSWHVVLLCFSARYARLLA